MTSHNCATSGKRRLVNAKANRIKEDEDFRNQLFHGLLLHSASERKVCGCEFIRPAIFELAVHLMQKIVLTYKPALYFFIHFQETQERSNLPLKEASVIKRTL